MLGLVVKNTGSWYCVKADDGRMVDCKVKGNFRLKGIRSTNPVAVGDRVEIRLNPEGTAFITAICDRRNYIIRRSSNLSKQSHILAANVDQALLVVTVNYPETSTTFIDRFLAGAEAYRVPVILAFNKLDLLSEDERRYQAAMRFLYENIGYTVVELSAHDADDVARLLPLLQGQSTLLSGNSGVGKSTLMSMMAKHTSSDVSVIGLIGERGREAKEFVEDVLGKEGLEKSVLVLATSDESPLMRRQAAYVTMAVAEYFRDLNKDVLCMMDSITRFAMAQREISLSVGEPPASKGYTPSVFAELPRLLERAGPGASSGPDACGGTITGLFTVLVDGDDHNEPVADAVRSILDGHIVLDRAIAERNRYPAINILRSISRTMPDCDTPEEFALVSKARKYIAAYEDMAELIRLGAYKSGSNRGVDEAIFYYPKIEEFLSQKKGEKFTLDEGYRLLKEILDTPYMPPNAAKG